jgi:DNA/RNA endonuclease G (NUC1)
MRSPIIILAIFVVVNAQYYLYNGGKTIDYSNYVVDYNTSYGQANYVVYISTSGNNNYSGCSYFNRSANYTSKDYTNTGFDRGHLVPDADYGKITCTMYNVVPMYPNFNRGIWKSYEFYVREKYAGMMIIKGCKYNPNARIFTPTGKLLYYPLGCYFIVTDSAALDVYSKFNIIDYGYLVNSYAANNTLYKELPWWIN